MSRAIYRMLMVLGSVLSFHPKTMKHKLATGLDLLTKWTGNEQDIGAK